MSTKDKEYKRATSCGGVVWRVREGKLELLLIKQFANKERWGIPKGHTHPGETLEECARREIKEEAGVDVVLAGRLMNVETLYKDEQKTVVSWLAQPIGSQEPRHDDPDSEVADARWFGISELPEILMYQRPLIASAIEALLKAQSPPDPEQ